MKRFLLLLTALLLVLCSCSGNEPPEKPLTADMLNITDTEKTFLGCRNRLDAVLEAMSAKIEILENAHNDVIKAENKTEYFLEDKYILTSFEPFIIDSLEITDGFHSEMTNETAQTYYKLQSDGMGISFESDGKSSFELQFISETVVKKYFGEYNEKTDSLRYIFSTENNGNETVEEFLEFTRTESGAYVIQSNSSRCYIEFNEDDEIVYFCCGELNTDEFLSKESVFPSPDEMLDRYWVLSKGKPEFSNIHTFENNMLIHEDCSSGPWKTIRINAEDYASAFYNRNER